MIHIISADSTGRLFTVYQFLQFDFENIVRLIKINHFINMSIVSKYTKEYHQKAGPQQCFLEKATVTPSLGASWKDLNATTESTVLTSVQGGA